MPRMTVEQALHQALCEEMRRDARATARTWRSRRDLRGPNQKGAVCFVGTVLAVAPSSLSAHLPHACR